MHIKNGGFAEEDEKWGKKGRNLVTKAMRFNPYLIAALFIPLSCQQPVQHPPPKDSGATVFEQFVKMNIDCHITEHRVIPSNI